MPRSGMFWSAIRAAMGCSRAAIAESAPGPAYQAPPVTALGSPFSFVDLCIPISLGHLTVCLCGAIYQDPPRHMGPQNAPAGRPLTVEPHTRCGAFLNLVEAVAPSFATFRRFVRFPHSPNTRFAKS
jgi:hypothetical protein